jgi:hypothetical protein
MLDVYRSDLALSFPMTIKNENLPPRRSAVELSTAASSFRRIPYHCVHGSKDASSLTILLTR